MMVTVRMVRVIFLSVLVGVLLFGTTVSMAATKGKSLTGHDLYERCHATLKILDKREKPKDVKAVYHAAWCLGYVRGFVGMHSVHDKKPLYCPAAGTTIGQEVRALVRYLEGHPKELSEKPDALTLKALRAAYPCQ